MASRCGEDTASARRADATPTELIVLRWTNRAYDPTLTIRKHLDTEQTRVSLDLNSPRAGISSGRVGGKLVTLMRSSSAEHGQLWWNRISDSGCVAVQTGLLLLLKVVSRGVLKRRRWRSGGVTQGASKSSHLLEQVSDQPFCLLDFVPRRLTTSQQMWTRLTPSTSQCVDKPSVCHLLCTEMTWSHFNWPILNEPTF